MTKFSNLASFRDSKLIVPKISRILVVKGLHNPNLWTVGDIYGPNLILVWLSKGFQQALGIMAPTCQIRDLCLPRSTRRSWNRKSLYKNIFSHNNSLSSYFSRYQCFLSQKMFLLPLSPTTSFTSNVSSLTNQQRFRRASLQEMFPLPLLREMFLFSLQVENVHSPLFTRNISAPSTLGNTFLLLFMLNLGLFSPLQFAVTSLLRCFLSAVIFSNQFRTTECVSNVLKI
jgi:hypothetical protein